MGALEIPARQGVKAGGRHDAPVLQGRVRPTAPCAASSVVVFPTGPHDGVPVLDGLRVGLEGECASKDGT